MRKVIVTGGRNYADQDVVWSALDRINPDVVIQGECSSGGADLLAKNWCRARGKPCIGMEAHFSALGRRAGPVRNGWMIDFNMPIAGVLAFPGGRGTNNMIEQARERGIRVHKVGWR